MLRELGGAVWWHYVGELCGERAVFGEMCGGLSAGGLVGELGSGCVDE